MKAWLAGIAPSLGPLGRWFRRVFALDRRYGVRFNGGLERSGFYTDRHARGWATDRGYPEGTFVVFQYNPVDLRLPGISHPQRDGWRQ